MKNLIFIFSFFFLWQFNAIAQPVIQWQKCLGGSSDEEVNSIQQTFDSGYIVCGYSTSTDGDVTGNHGLGDYWVVKLASSGSLQWQKSLGGSGDDFGKTCRQTSDSGYIVCGYSTSFDGDVTSLDSDYSFEYWIVKLSSSGIIQWQKSYGGLYGNYASDIKQTYDGGYIVAGYSYSANGEVTGHHGDTSTADYWVVKLSDTGAIQWEQSFGGTGNDYAYSVIQTADSGYVVAGNTESTDGDITGNHGPADYWIVKLSPAGSLQWQKCFGGTGDDEAYSIIQTLDGGYIVAGSSNSTDGDVSGNHGNYDHWIVKITGTGAIQWEQSYGGSNLDWAESIWQTSDSSYVVAGDAYSTDDEVSGNHGLDDYWITQLSSSGSLLWQKCFGGSNYDGALSIQQTSDQGYIVAGTSESNDGDVTGNHGNTDYWVVKLSFSSDVNAVSSINNRNNNITLFPNPTNNELTITATNKITNVVITDLIGQQVYNQSCSSEKLEINTASLPAGIYMVSITDNEGNKTVKKIVKQ